MECHHQAELVRLRAQVAALEARAERAEETVHLQAQALADLSRHAVRVTERVTGVRDSVTLVEEKEERKRELDRVRQRNRRIRQHSVTVTHSEGVTSQVSPPPSPSVTHGALTLVTRAARDGRRDSLRTHHRPDTLPKPVQELREAWNELVVPHGFPEWGQVTSGQLLEDAERALERHPLEQWRHIFALVPRSPVCRGELGSRQRASIVSILTGRNREGHRFEDLLLTGYWSIDPEPPGEKPEPGAVIDLNHVEPGPEGQRAVSTWELVLAQLRLEGKYGSLENLEYTGVAPVALHEEKLLLWCKDEHAVDYLTSMFTEPLNERLKMLGVPGGVCFTTGGEQPGSAPGHEVPEGGLDWAPEPPDGS